MYLFAIIIIALFALFGIMFGAQNATQITLHFFGKSFEAPLISVVIIAFGGGVVFAFILAIVDEIKLRTRIGKQEREIDSLKKELGALKTMPTEEEEK